MKKIFFLLIIFISSSCSSIKIKDRDIDTNAMQKLVGNVKAIKLTTYKYNYKKNDTTVTKSFSEFFYNKKNQVIKQVDNNGKYENVTESFYKKNLLIKEISLHNEKRDTILYYYDKKQNLVDYKQILNNKLYFHKKSKFDSHGNPIEETYTFPNYPHNNSTQIFNYDYKNKSYLIQGYDENNIKNERYLLRNFDNNGFITKSELIYKNSNKDSSKAMYLEFDKKGNLTKKYSKNKDGSIKEPTLFINKYDKKGNIIQREKVIKNIILEKLIFEIEYW